MLRGIGVLGSIFIGLLILSHASFPQENSGNAKHRRNAIIFVADGLRAGSVNEKDTPTLWSVRTRGVNFSNSHSLFPTFTTANASAIATGHMLGDTGDYSNTIWTGYATFDTGNFDLPPGTPTPFLENDQILSDLASHYDGNYLGETTLLAAASENGFNTAAIGKLGPAAIQQIQSISAVQRRFPVGSPALVVDDATGTSAGVPLPLDIVNGLLAGNFSTEAPTRSNGYGPNSDWNNGNSGSATHHGTLQANLVQQQWFAEVATHIILPKFSGDKDKPFVLLFWSRDPDGSQHNQGDSLQTFDHGINGDTSREGVRNADRNLKQILDWLDANPSVKAQTDVFVTSDHGFATISRREISRTARKTSSEAAQHYYLDSSGNTEEDQGTLPNGFLAIDLALGLHTNLFDPDRHGPEGSRKPFRQMKLNPEFFEHPAFGNGLLGLDVEAADGSDAEAIVAANGGSDLIYVPDHNPETVRQIVSLLATYDYVGGIFVDDQYGSLPGSLPLSAIGLEGNTNRLPRPAIVVAFKVFYLNPTDLQTAIQIADTSLQEGQGMHGGFGRDSTFNNMAAMGPDFKPGFTDESPVSNADIAPTIAHILGFDLPSKGKLKGRVILESLPGQPDKVASSTSHLESADASGRRTLMQFQEADGERYIDTACFLEKDSEAMPDVCPR